MPGEAGGLEGLRPRRAPGAAARMPLLARATAHLAVWVAAFVPTFVVLARGWAPLGDDAAIAIRAHQVLTRHPPLVGFSTTTADASGHRLHDLGPALFWLLALPVRADPLRGLVWGAALLGAVVLSVAVEAVWSTGRWFGCLVVAFAAADYLWRVPAVPANPAWNAYFPIPFLLASLALAWVVATGALGWWPALVATGSVAAQTHLVYVPVAAILVVGAPVLGLATRGRPRRVRSLALGAAVGILLWLPPLVQQLGGQGNLAAVADDRTAHEGLDLGLRAVALAGVPPPLWLRGEPIGFYPVFGALGNRRPLSGALVVAALVALAVVAWRRQRRDLAVCAAVAIGACGGTLAAFALVPTANAVNVVYVVCVLWAVSLACWTAALWAITDLARAATTRFAPLSFLRFLRSPRPLGTLAGALGVVVVIVALVLGTLGFGPSGAADASERVGVSSSARMARIVEQSSSAREPVGVYVDALDGDGLSSVVLTDALAWRLVSDGREVVVPPLFRDATGLSSAPRPQVYLMLTEGERLVASRSGRCDRLDDACLRRLEARAPR